MKTNNTPWILFIVTFIILLCVVTCKGGKERTIYIKEKSGSFHDTIIKHDTITLKNPFLIKWKDKEVVIYKKIDTSSLKSYILKDSIEKLNSYINAISINNYKNIKEDSLVKIEVSGLVKSEIKSMDIYYKLKKQELKSKELTSSFRLGLGLESQINVNPIYKPSLFIGIGENNQFIYSFDNTGRHWIGYQRNFINYKK